MYTTRAAFLGVLVALVFAPWSAYAQGGGGGGNTTILARIAALEAALEAETQARQAADVTLQGNITAEATTRASADTTLQNTITSLTTQVNKLRGIGLAVADLAGTYRISGIITDLDADPARVEVISLTGTMTLNANFTGTMTLAFHGIDVEEGAPWSGGVIGPFSQSGNVIWNPLPNGTVNVTDGTPDLNLNFTVGVGFRVWTYSGVSDDNTVDFVVLTRLQ